RRWRSRQEMRVCRCNTDTNGYKSPFPMVSSAPRSTATKKRLIVKKFAIALIATFAIAGCATQGGEELESRLSQLESQVQAAADAADRAASAANRASQEASAAQS